jgi:hypothetical protein
MTDFKKYIHVERLGELPHFLEGHIIVTPKVDSTNGSIWYDGNEIQCGSRNRKLSEGKDNAGFWKWVHKESPQMADIIALLYSHPSLIIYGEWIPETKFIGKIKTYDTSALGSFQIFDIFDTDSKRYVPYTALHHYAPIKDYLVPVLAEIDNPTVDELMEIADNNHYLLNDDCVGEGLVLRNEDYRDNFGNYHIAKIVLEEWKELAKTKKERSVESRKNCEQSIVDNYLTEAELSKTYWKICTRFDTDKINIRDGKMVGMMLNWSYKEAIIDELWVINKKYKKPVIDFQVLQDIAFAKTREFLGLK